MRKVFVSILIAFIVFAPIDLVNFSQLFIHADDNNEFIDTDTVWQKGDHIVDKNVYIDSDATLTIEKGARILFKNFENGSPSIQVSSGRIIADGTMDEKIIFASLDPENDNYFISFDRYNGGNSSLFRWVEFQGNGQSFYAGGVAMNNIRGFFNTAKAESLMPSQIEIFAGKVHIENSTFSNFADFPVKVDFSLNNDNTDSKNKLEIVNSNFKDFALDSEMRCNEVDDLSCKERILLKNNWYGSERGPDVYDGNWNSELGARAQGKFKLDGWRKKDLIVDPVILVPGIMGSAEVLGKWKLDPILHVYDDLIDSFEKNGFVEGENFFPFPYNWRKSNLETANYLKDAINVVKNLTGVSKVSIVAHSMGGLSTRVYIEGDNYQDDIGKFITLATPHRGSPEAYLKWEAGEGFFTWEDKVASRHFENEASHAGYDDLKTYIQNKVVSVGELLPDYDYLFDVERGEMRSYPDNYPRNVFLENLNEANNIEKLKGVDFVNIVGNENANNTITKIKIINNGSNAAWEYGIPENFNNKNTDRGLIREIGDQTVPVFSSTTIPSNKEIELDSSHQQIPEKAQCEVVKELTARNDCTYVDEWHATNILLLNVFSPIDIQIVSPSGKRVGKDFEHPDKTLNEIEGAYYTGFDTDNEFLTIPNPEDGEYKILTQGMGNGEYKIEASKISKVENLPNAIESTVSITGSATLDKKEQASVTISDQQISKTQDDAPPTFDQPVNPPAIDPLQTPEPLVANANSSPPISQQFTVENRSKSKKGGSHKKHKKQKKHKKTSKKALTATAKRVLGVSQNKCQNKKTLACKAANFVTKSTGSSAQKTSSISKNTGNFFSTVKNYAANRWGSWLKR